MPSYVTMPPPFGTSAFPKQYLIITSLVLYPRPMSIVHARGSLWCGVLVGGFWWVWLTLCRNKSGQDCRDQSPGILDAVHVAWILLPNHSFISCKRECIFTLLQRSVPLSYYSCMLQSTEGKDIFPSLVWDI
jgi:hypothetical protein